MAFDGRDYDAPTLVAPYRYHADAPATAFAVSEVLQNAYVAARRNERIVFQTCYSFDHRDPSTGPTAPYQANPTSSTPIRVGEGFRRIPLEATHVASEIQWISMGSVNTKATHRISVRTPALGTPATVGSDVDTELEINEATRRAGGFGGHSQTISNFLTSMRAGSPFRFSSFVEVELAPNQAGALCEIYVEAWLKYYANSAGYRPLSVVAFWEIRE